MLTPLLIVAGIGEGLLVIFIALAISGFLCFYGLKTTKPGLYCAGAFCLSFIVIIFFAYVPKEDGSLTPQEVFDPYFSRRVAMMTFVFLGGVAGLVLCMLEVLLHRQQASRFMWK